MHSIRWIEYEATWAGVAEVANKLCRNDSRFSTLYSDILHHVADFEFRSDGGLTLHISNRLSAYGPEVFHYYTYRVLGSVPLMDSVRQRYPTLQGIVRLDLDDIGATGRLSFSSNSAAFVLIPDSEYLAAMGYQWCRNMIVERSAEWADRQDQVVWRGSSTGFRSQGGEWETIQRAKMCLLARNLDQSVFNIGLSDIVQIGDETERAAIEASGIMRPRIEWNETRFYRYAIDIDGNSCAWSGLFTKLLTGSTVLKVSSTAGYRQWYYDRLIPWVNFVPIAADLSDLEAAVTWLRANPQRAAEIGAKGRALALSLEYDDVIDDVAPRIKRAVEASGYQS